MSYTEIEFGDTQDQQDMSKLYASVNFENKTNRKKKNLEKRISNKFEFVIPVENTELSNSDSNLHSTHESDSLLSSRSLFGSADDIISDKSIQNGTAFDSTLMRHNTGTFRKIRAPPPAIPPPYQVRGDYEIIQQQPKDDSPFRRSKSINSKSQFTIANDSDQKIESNNEVIPNGPNASPKRIVPQSFRFHKEGKPKPLPGITMSLPNKPAMRPPPIIPTPFKPTNSPPAPILPQRKPSPPQYNNKQPSPTLNNNNKNPPPPPNNEKQPSPPLNDNNNNKQPSPILDNKSPPPPPNNEKQPSPPLNDNNNNRRKSSPIETNNSSPPPLPISKPYKSLPTVPIKPVLKPPILSNGSTQKPVPHPSRKFVPLSPPPAKPSKHPARLPPPPPAHSLTLPRQLTTLPKSPSIGDYTVLTPISPDSSPVDCPTFSPEQNSNSDSSLNETQSLITDEGYTILNVEEIQINSDSEHLRKPLPLTLASKEIMPIEFKRIGSSPVIGDRSNGIPPKKPPRLMHNSLTTPVITNESDYTILSSLESSMSLSEKQREFSNDDIKTRTLPIKGARTIPPKPLAYRNRSHSQHITSCINKGVHSNTLTNSVGAKPETKKNGDSTEGNIFSKVFQKSKRTRGKDQSKVSPTISGPTLDTQNANKVVGLNPLLISECIAYLRQPKSLREEGIFRIAGDLNQINIYHKQYDYSMKTNLDEELDPNTISSLLKQHIKENGGLLPKREAGDLYAAVRQKNVEEIRIVIDRIPAVQKNTLKEILQLFTEVCGHDGENRMCAGTIATSCGLSLFPNVNAGNANLMLKSLIDNVDKVFI